MCNYNASISWFLIHRYSLLFLLQLESLFKVGCLISQCCDFQDLWFQLLWGFMLIFFSTYQSICFLIFQIWKTIIFLESFLLGRQVICLFCIKLIRFFPSSSILYSVTSSWGAAFKIAVDYKFIVSSTPFIFPLNYYHICGVCCAYDFMAVTFIG